MSTVLPTTDEIHTAVIGALNDRLPGVATKELPRPRDLWGCFADQYLGEWIGVASSAEESNGDPAAGNRQVTWSLERRTQYEGHVHVRGTIRIGPDRTGDIQQDIAAAEIRRIAAQISAVGEVHELLLVREPDIEALYGKTLNLMLLAHVESNYRDQIRMDDRGVPWLQDTQIKVREIVLDYLCYGWSTFRIFREHGDSIPLERIHAAFTYFDNHRIAVLKEIEEATAEADRLCRELENPRIMAKLRAAKAARQ